MFEAPVGSEEAKDVPLDLVRLGRNFVTVGGVEFRDNGMRLVLAISAN